MFSKLFHDMYKPVKSRWKKYFLSFGYLATGAMGSYLKMERRTRRNKRILCEIDILLNVVKKSNPNPNTGISPGEMMVLTDVFLCVYQDVGS